MKNKFTPEKRTNDINMEVHPGTEIPCMKYIYTKVNAAINDNKKIEMPVYIIISSGFDDINKMVDMPILIFFSEE